MIVALPFCNKDAHLHIANLELCNIMELKTPYPVVLCYEYGVDRRHVSVMKSLCANFFEKQHDFEYENAPDPTWPSGPNHAFRSVAMHIEKNFPTEDGWFWWEADATPLKGGWLQLIHNRHRRGGKPFTGHIVDGMGHMTGVGVYPAQIRRYLYSCFAVDKLAWDVAMKPEMLMYCHQANDVFQHWWTMTPERKPSLDNQYPAPTFKTWDDVANTVDFNTGAIFHRCKDGTLAKLLADHYNGFRVKVDNYAPKLTRTHEPAAVKPRVKFAKNIRMPKVEALVCTFIRDIEWLELNIQCFNKFCHGFTGYTVVVPEHDKALFEPLALRLGVNIRYMVETPGKGFLQHMIVKCRPEQYMTTEADFVMTFDADCMFKALTTPLSYVTDGKPHYVVRTYESLNEKGSEKVSDSFQWKTVVKANIGFDPQWYSMCRHPTVWPVDLFGQFRKHVEEVHQQPFDNYVLSCRNDFPQTFAEYPAMGAWAMRYAYDRFFWIDCSNGLAPVDRLQNFWPRGGLKQIVPRGTNLTARDEIRGFLES